MACIEVDGAFANRSAQAATEELVRTGTRSDDRLVVRQEIWA